METLKSSEDVKRRVVHACSVELSETPGVEVSQMLIFFFPQLKENLEGIPF